MKLSKLGLWFLAAYLLWAGVSYSSYRECLTYPQGGFMGIALGCQLSLVVGILPLGSIAGISNMQSDNEQRFFIGSLFCCILYYTFGAGIGWLRRPRKHR